MAQRKSKEKIETVDPIWHSVRQGGQEIAQSEPSLSSFMVSTILNHERLEDALAFRLACRLDHADVSADLIRQAFGIGRASCREGG